MHPYYGAGYQQRTYASGSDRADIYVIPTYVQQYDQQWTALDSHNQGHEASFSEELPPSGQRRQYAPTLLADCNTSRYVNHIMKTDRVYEPTWHCQDWTFQSQPLHVPASTIIPSECGPPNQHIVGQNDCCFQPDSTSGSTPLSSTPSSTKSALSTPASLATPLHIPMDSPVSNHIPVRDCRTLLDNNEVELRIVSVSSGRWSCRSCQRVFRRRQRALLHFLNKHEGLRLPCNGVCGDLQCRKSFACQEGLDVHVNPVEVSCQYCGKNLLKKNILRHQREHCHLSSA